MKEQQRDKNTTARRKKLMASTTQFMITVAGQERSSICVRGLVEAHNEVGKRPLKQEDLEREENRTTNVLAVHLDLCSWGALSRTVGSFRANCLFSCNYMHVGAAIWMSPR